MVSIVTAARDLGRLREISLVLVRHGFGEIVNRLGLSRGAGKAGGGEATGDPSVTVPPEAEAAGRQEKAQVSRAVRARLVLEDLGPSFVKLGQIASTRADLLPPDLIAELKKLQDAVPPLGFDTIKEQIERSLGAPPEELFESIDERPLAAASIAQVHRATLKTEEGLRDVVVKVQRPGIASTIASDIDLLHGLAALIERAIPESRIYSPVRLVQQFDQAITAELDFASEADNARRFAQNFADDPRVRFPTVFRQASGKQVITLEYLEGHKIYDAVAAGYSGKEIARLALRVLVRQIFDDGFFHADPHPGNVLVWGPPEEPRLAMLDLGMVGRLSPRMRDLTVDVILAAHRRDYDGIADALYEIGTPTKKIDMDAYRAEVALLAERYIGKSLREVELSAMIRDVVRAALKYGIEIPADFLMMSKSLMTVEGIGKEIDPDFDVYEESKPLFSEILKKRYSPERLGNQLLRHLERLGGVSYKVPQQLEEVLDDLRLGRLQVNTQDSSHVAALERHGRRLFTALVSSALLLAGAFLVARDQRYVGYALLGAAGLFLTWHAWREIFYDLRRRR